MCVCVLPPPAPPPPVGLLSSPPDVLLCGGILCPVGPVAVAPPRPPPPGGLASIEKRGSCECLNRVFRSSASAARTARICCATDAAIRSCLDTRKRSKIFRLFFRCVACAGGLEVRPATFWPVGPPPEVSPLWFLKLERTKKTERAFNKVNG